MSKTLDFTRKTVIYETNGLPNAASWLQRRRTPDRACDLVIIRCEGLKALEDGIEIDKMRRDEMGVDEVYSKL